MRTNNKLSRILALLFVVLIFFSISVYAEDEFAPEVSAEEEVEDPFIYETEDDKDKTSDNSASGAHETKDSSTNGEVETADNSLISKMREYSFLEKMGFKLSDEKQTQELAREKAAMYFASLYDTEVSPQAEITYFKDVTLENRYLNYINFGCENGYISGTGDGYYNPKNSITVAEFVAVIFRITGYKNYIQAKGGSISQIMILADRCGLIDGISDGFQDSVTEKDALIILSNALDMPLCSITGVDNGNLIYDMKADRTLLEQNFDIRKEYGIICAVEDASLPGYSYAGKNCVTLNGNSGNSQYTLENLSADKLLGQDTCCYVKDNKVIYIEPEHNADSMVLKYGEFRFSSDRTVLLTENSKGKTKKEKIAYDAVFIYNGKQCNNISTEELNSPNTHVEIVDIDSDNVYEVVYAEHLSPMVVEELADPIYTYGTDIEQYDSQYPMYPDVLVDKAEKTPVFTSYAASERSTGKSIELNVNSNEYRLKILKDGQEIKYSDIKKGDLLSVCESKDGEKKTVYVSSKKDEDVVAQLDSDDNKIITSAGTEYTYTFELPKTSVVGKSAILYIDDRGFACAYRFADDGEIVYGYLLAYGGNGSVLSRKWKAKIFTMDKTTKIFDFAQTFYQNDLKTDGESFDAYFANTGHQLVKYMLNGDGEIKRIYTSTEPQGYELRKEKPIFVMNEHYNGDTGKYGLYRKTTIEQEYSPLAAKHLVVIVDDNGNVVDDRVYLVKTFKYDRAHDLKVYDAQTGKVATFLVNTVKESEIETKNAISDFFFVIEDIRMGQDGKFLVGMTRNKENKPFLYHFYETKDGVFDGLKPGDVIKIIWYETDENGNYRISDYTKVFTTEANGTENMEKTICGDYAYSSEFKPITNGRNMHSKQLYGTITAMASASDPDYDIEHRIFSVVLQPEGTDSPEDCYVFSYSRDYISSLTFKVFRYNMNRGILKCEDGYELKPGDKVFVATNYYSAAFIVIYE